MKIWFLAILIILIGSFKIDAQNCATITNISSSTSICVGSNTTFSVVASSPDNSTLSYSWYKNGVVIVNEISPSYTITNAQLADASSYYAKVSNACGTATSSAIINLSVGTVPSITSIDNAAESLCVGSSFSTSVIANSNSIPFVYQWYLSGVPIVGKISSSLNIASLQSSNAGLYSVSLSNSCGAASFTANQLTISSAPSITVQPLGATKCVGNSFALTPTVIGAQSYQWKKDNSDISTSSTFTIGSVQTSDAGTYSLIATNGCGNATSASAVLATKFAPTITSFGSSSSVCKGTNTSLTATVSGNGDNVLSYTWAKDGVGLGTSSSNILSLANFQPANVATYSLSVSNSCGTANSPSGQNVALALSALPTITTISDPAAICLNGSLTVNSDVTTNNGGSLSYQWYNSNQAIATQTSSQLLINSIQTAAAGSYYLMATNNCGSTASNLFSVVVNTTPVITQQPATQLVCVGATLGLNVTATGATSYQWKYNGLAINNETSTSYSKSSIPQSDAGNYTVGVTNSCGTTTSSAAVVTVNTLPTITVQPQPQTVCAGTSASFQVTASTSPVTSLSYKWYQSGVEISGATNSSYTTLAASAATYTVVVTNSCGSTTSSGAALTVTSAPVITVQPLGGTKCVGNSFALTPTVTGAQSYQWKINNTDYLTSATIPTFSVKSTDAGSYSLIATNGCGSVTSVSAVLAIKDLPTITSFGSSNSVCKGTNTSLTATVSGNGDNALSYTWSMNTSVLGTSSSNVLSLANFQPANVGTYSLSVSNSCGTTNSSIGQNVALALSALPTIAAIIDPAAVCLNGSLTVNSDVTTNNGGSLSYQWYNSNQAIATQTSSQLLINSIQTAAAGSYYLMATNNCGSTASNLFNVVVNTTPVITQQPATQLVCVGATLGLSVTATGATSYQWKYNGLAINNETSTSYSKSSIPQSDAGNYTVGVTNSCGTTTSSAAVVTVNTLPTITVQPQPQTVCAGTSASFQVTASTSPVTSLSYKWYQSGVEISGATNSYYTTLAASAATYTVVVTNSCGSTTSSGAALTVTSAPSITVQPLGSTQCVGTGFALTPPVTGAQSYQWKKDNINYSTSSTITIGSIQTNDAGTYSLIATNGCGNVTSASAVLAIKDVPAITSFGSSSSVCKGTNTSLTATVSGNGDNALSFTWSMNTSVLGTNSSNVLSLANFQPANVGTYSLSVSNSCGTTNSSIGQNVALALSALPTIAAIIDPAAVCLNGSLTVNSDVTTNNGGSLTYQWYNSNQAIATQTNSQLLINTIQTTAAGSYYLMATNNCGSTASNLLNVVVNSTPVITQQPTTQLVCAGVTLGLSVAATGATSYQWKYNGLAINNETSANYSKSNIQQSDAGNYTVSITNSCGTTTSSAAVLTVNTVPTITVQPQPQTVCAGTSASFQVTASTSPITTLSYQWYQSGVEISGATGSSYTTLAASAATYTVVVTNSCGSTTSSGAALTVTSAPSITVQPLGSTLCVGTGFALTPTVTGAQSYQWKKDNINYSTSSTITIGAVQTNDAGTYSLIATNGCGNVTSASAVLITNDKPTITSLGSGSSVCSGANPSLTAIVSGNGDNILSYTWAKGGSGLGTSSSNVLSLANFQLANVGTYSLSVSNSCGTTNSSIGQNVALALSALPTIAAISDPAAVCSNGSLTVSSVVTNNNGGNLNYQWYNSNQAIATQTNSQLLINTIQSAAAGSYYLMATNNCGSTVSNLLNVIVNSTPVITQQPATQSICTAATLDLSVYATAATSYQWKYNGLAINSETSANYSKNSILQSNAGNYTVSVTNGCGTTESSTAVVTVNTVPTITAQPQPQTVCAGASASFQVTASTSPVTSLSYKWYQSGVEIPGATGSTYTIQSATANDASYTYLVKINNACGLVSSSSVALVVNQSPTVTIASDKLSDCISTGSINFTSSVTGNNLSYAWYRDQTLVGTQASLALSNFASNVAGTYSLVVSNSCASITSNTINITSMAPPSITTAFSSSTANACLNSNVLLTVVANSNNGGLLSYNWVGGVNNLNSTTTDNSYTISNFTSQNAGTYHVVIANSCGTVTSGLVTIALQNSLNNAITTQPVSAYVCSDKSYALSVGLTGSYNNLSYSWLYNNLPIGNSNSGTYTINSVTQNTSGNYSVIITSACDQVTSSIATVNLYSIPSFSINPQDLNTCLGNNSSFSTSVSAGNGGLVKSPVSFNWYQNGNLITQNISSTITQTSLTLNNVSANNQGKYQIFATDGCVNTIASNIFNLTVNSAPSFTIHPQSTATFCTKSTNGSPNSVTLSTAAENADHTTSNLVYQWYFNNTAISGANGTTYKAESAGTYYVTVTNSSTNCGVTKSNSSTIASYNLPNASSVTADFALCYPTNQTKIITVVPFSNDGTTPLVSWSTTTGNILSNGPNSITVGPTTNSQYSATYDYQISNTCGAYISKVVVETEMNRPSVVEFAPQIPSNVYCAGKNISLSVTTNSTAQDFVDYSWTLNSSLVQSASYNNVNSKTYTSLIPLSTTSTSETFIVTISNTCGALATPVAIPISINPSLAANFSISNSNSQCLAGNNFSFSNTSTNYDNASSPSVITYVWDFGDGQTQNTIGSTAPNNQTYSTGGTKTVKLVGTNSYGCSTSKEISLIVQTAPVFTKQPVLDTTICSGSSYQISTVANIGGSNSVSYQWYFNDVPITGATLVNYIITNMSPANAGNYYLIVTNSGCNLFAKSLTAVVHYQLLPTSSFTFSNQSANYSTGSAAIACAANANFNFTANAPPISGMNYLWSFGDNTTALGQNVTHQFGIGSYNVSLTTSSNGCSSSSNATATSIKIDGAPSISTNLPPALVIKSGSPINLSVSALNNNISNVSTINYQWYFNNNIVPAEITNTYNIATSSSLNAGPYYVTVKNICGTVISNVVNISIINAPSITTQPISQSVCMGSNASLSVTATVNDGSIATYQWYYQQLLTGGPLPITQSVTNVLSLSSFSQTNVGYYYVAVTNTVGTTNSNVVYLGDETAPTITPIVSTPSILGSICVNSTIQLSSTFDSKRKTTPNITWSHNNQVLNNQNSLQLNLNNLSVSDSGRYLLQVSNACGLAKDSVRFSIQNVPQFTQAPIKTIGCVGGNAVLSAVLQNPSSNDLYQWVKNGINYSGTAMIQNSSISFNNLLLQDSGQYAVTVINSCGSNLSSSAALVVVGNPIIAQQPVNMTVCSNVQLIDPVIASSSDNVLNYVWYKNGVLQPSLLTSQLVFNAISASDAGSYKTIVTNGCNNSVTSNTVQITVKELISLNSQISNKTVCVGNLLNVDLTGQLDNIDNNTTYNWKLNNINLNYASANTINLQNQNILRTDAGAYSIAAKNACGNSQIQLFDLTVNGVPSITTQPVSAAICEGSNFGNAVFISNPDQLFNAYQWLKNGVQIPGANASSYTINNANASDQAQFQVNISNQCGVIQSIVTSLQINPKPFLQIQATTPTSQCFNGNSFSLNSIIQLSDNSVPLINWNFGDGASSSLTSVQHSYNTSNTFNVELSAVSSKGCVGNASQIIYVNSSPFISQQPTNLNICEGGGVDIGLQVRHNPNQQFGYQWYFSDQIIPNGTDSVYKIANLQSAQTGYYKVLIQNQCGNKMSNSMQLKMAKPPLETIAFADSVKVCDLTETTLKPTIYSILPNTFQWYKNEMPIIGQTNDSLLFRNFTIANNGKYYATVQNNCGLITTATIKLIDRVAPISSQVAVSDTICHGSTISLTFNKTSLLNNDDTSTYSWYKDGQLLNLKNDKLPIASFKYSDVGAYDLKIGNNCGSIQIPITNLVMNYPKIGFKVDTANACKENLSIHLVDTSKGLFNLAHNYWYSEKNTLTLKDASIVDHIFTLPGKYKILHAITDAKGCSSDTLYQYVTNYGKPTASFAINDTCFSFSSIPMNTSTLGFASTLFTKFTWNFGDTTIVTNEYATPKYLYKTPGQKKIFLTVTTDSSCVADTITKSFMVFGKPLAQFAIQDTCQGFPVNMFSNSLTQFQPDSIGQVLWNFGDSTATSSLKNPVHIFNQYGAYKIKLRAYSATCPMLYTDTTVNYTIVHPRDNLVYPIVHAVKFEPRQLNASNSGVNYNWYPFTGLNDSKIKNPTTSIDSGKVVYTITIKDSSGCIYKDKQEVWSLPVSQIYVPTAFSPNGDGINDFYQPVYVGIKYLEYFRIADKNNRQIYITNNLNDKWDGTRNGVSVVADAYIMDVSGIDMQGNRIKKQGVLILVK